MNSPAASPSLPPAVRAVLELFDGPLADLRFPDVDRESLRAAEEQMESKRSELGRALEAVAAARVELEQAQTTLLEQVRRAHAYATIYAGDDPQLSAKLGQIEVHERPAAPKKRGRPPKKAKQQTSLAVADDAA